VIATLVSDNKQFMAKMVESKGAIDDLNKSGSSSFSKLSSIGRTALLGIGTAAIGVGAIAVDFGDKLEASQAGLQASLKAAGISWKSVEDSVKSTGAESTKYGFTQAQVDSALSLGVISTQSYTEAHKNLNVAIELAAAKHVDLNTAMQAVDKATQGNTRALMQLGISLPIASTSALKLKTAEGGVQAAQLKALTTLREFPDALDASSKHHAVYQTALDNVTVAQGKLKDQQQASSQILDALSQRLGGQAAAAAGTFQGKVKAMEAEGENLAATIGIKLIPVLEGLITDVQKVVDWFGRNQAVAEALGAALGGLAAVAATAFAIDKVSKWISTIQSAIGWVNNLGSAVSKIPAVGGVGGVGAGAVGAGEVGAGEAGTAGAAATATSLVPVIVPAVIAAIGVGTLVAGIMGLIKTSGQGSGQPGTGTALQRQREKSGADTGMGGLVTSPAAVSGANATIAGFAAAISGLAAGKGGTDTPQQQLAVLNQMKAQLASDSTKYGGTSAQAHADAAALASTANKWGAENSTISKMIPAGIQTSYLQLLGLNAKQADLGKSGAGNLEQSKFIKAVLDNELQNAKSVLSKDETAKASKSAIDLARQKVTDTQNEIKGTTSHIDQLKTVASQITTTKDTISSQQKLSTDLGKVNSDTSAIKTIFGTGITITKLPDKNTKMTGTVKVSF